LFKPKDVAAALQRGVFWIGEGGIDLPLCAALSAELQTLVATSQLQPAGVGRAASHRRDAGLRGDRIAWLTSATPSQRLFLKTLERLRVSLNRTLFLGVTGIEAHFANYPAGTRYACHVDSFVGASNRVVSVVAYLNVDWQRGDGGELVLYAPDAAREIARVEPRAGTVVVFLSEEVPHEVLPAVRQRDSIAAWFRRR